MKIAIVSDTHNNWANFKKAIDWIKNQNIQVILHCGDISTQEIIDEAEKHFNGNIYFVKGNADYNLDLSEKMELEFACNPSTDSGQVKIVFCHFPDEAKKLAESGKYNLVFHGHTHKPREEKIGDCRLVNPGEVAGQLYKPTFAVYDIGSDKLELKIIERLV